MFGETRSHAVRSGVPSTVGDGTADGIGVSVSALTVAVFATADAVTASTIAVAGCGVYVGKGMN